MLWELFNLFHFANKFDCIFLGHNEVNAVAAPGGGMGGQMPPQLEALPPHLPPQSEWDFFFLLFFFFFFTFFFFFFLLMS